MIDWWLPELCVVVILVSLSIRTWILERRLDALEAASAHSTPKETP